MFSPFLQKNRDFTFCLVFFTKKSSQNGVFSKSREIFPKRANFLLYELTFVEKDSQNVNGRLVSTESVPSQIIFTSLVKLTNTWSFCLQKRTFAGLIISFCEVLCTYFFILILCSNRFFIYMYIIILRKLSL